jgi:hypothetical protein
MKNIKIYIKVFIAVLFWSGTIFAQMESNIKLNIVNQPIWGPTGYDQADNYFIPDIEVYYNVSQQLFYTNDEGTWVSSSSLPTRYGNYDLYKAHKVVLNDQAPWLNNNIYRARYFSLINIHGQKSIRDSKDSKYFANVNHPNHKNWVNKQKHSKNVKPNNQDFSKLNN